MSDKKKEMSLAELKKLVKQYDEFMGITIPKSIKKPEMVKLIEKQGYKIDHENKKLVATFKQKTKKMPKKLIYHHHHLPRKRRRCKK